MCHMHDWSGHSCKEFTLFQKMERSVVQCSQTQNRLQKGWEQRTFLVSTPTKTAPGLAGFEGSTVKMCVGSETHGYLGGQR